MNTVLSLLSRNKVMVGEPVVGPFFLRELKPEFFVNINQFILVFLLLEFYNWLQFLRNINFKPLMMEFLINYVYVDVLSPLHGNYEVSITNLSFTVFIVIVLMYAIFNRLFLGHMIPRASQMIFSLFSIKSKLYYVVIIIPLLLLFFIEPFYNGYTSSNNKKYSNKKKRKTKRSFKCINKRYYRISEIRLEPSKIKKFFKVVELTTNVLSRGFNKKQLKEIPTKNKEEVMKSIRHYQGEIEGTFKINNNEEEHIAFIGLTHSEKHNVENTKGEIVALQSHLIENKVHVGPEFRLINNSEIDKNKLYNKVDNSNLNQYKQPIENKINEMYEKEGKISYINGINDNKINHAVVIKTEKNGKIVFNLSDINSENLNKIDKINKID